MVAAPPFALPSPETLAAWLSRLVRIPSVSPAQAGPRAGPPGEQALGDAVAGWLAGFGLAVEREEVLPGRHNVYACWSGRSDRWLAVDAHLDTVGVEDMTSDPFSGRIAGGRVHGRGAVDTKATLAVVLALIEAAHAAGRTPAARLLIAATVDEECGFSGARALVRWARARDLVPDQLAVAEPTLGRPVYAHKGTLRPTFAIAGRAAHASQPELGRNAIAGAAALVLALEEEHQRLQREFPGGGEWPHVLGWPTLTTTLIAGGTGENIVPGACHVTADRRLVGGEDPAAVTAGLEAIARARCPLPVTVAIGAQSPAFIQRPDTPWLRELAAWSGAAPAVAPYGTNASFYGGFARECVVIGPGSIAQAHGAEEWVEIAELERIARLYAHWWGL